jgi:hypothetical protein
MLEPIQNVYILTNKNVWFMMVFTIMGWIKRSIYGKFGRIKKPANAGFLMSGFELAIFLF